MHMLIIKKKKKIANIIYYDENINDYLEEIHSDSDHFERITPGAFILTSNINSLNLVMKEIKKYNEKYDKRVIFNLIVTGSKFQKVMDHLVKNEFDKFIQNICIYCMRIDRYSHLQKKYTKIIGIYNKISQVESFIEKVSNEETKEFPIVKIINYNEYKDIYFKRHEKISENYGDLTKETYEKHKKLINKYIKENEDDLKKKSPDEVIDNFKVFEITEDKDLEELDKYIIKEYTKNTYYKNLNNWLIRNLDKEEIYDFVAYYTARLMKALNNYALKKNQFFIKKEKVFRGAQIEYTNLIRYERLKGKIIILSSFTSTTDDKSVTNTFSNRENSKNIYQNTLKFSVIYEITNIVKENNISCGINIQELSKYPDEKEILYQPFTFYLVKDIVFNYENYTADIELETIPKKEILEEKIKQGKKVIYDKNLNLILIKEN